MTTFSPSSSSAESDSGFTSGSSSKRNIIDPHVEDSIWKSFLATNPVVKFLKPDYYLIFRYTDTCSILYHKNISLDLGGPEVNLENVYGHMAAEDLKHIRMTDQLMLQLIRERKLQPWDYIYKIYGNVTCPNPALKRLLRSSILIHNDPHGRASIGFLCFHDVSGTVSSLKPNGFEISCSPELAFLSVEMENRLRKNQGPRIKLTRREKEIIQCIRKGMSSKEIAEHLFIAVATVNTHRQNMLRKWEVPNSAALLEKCIQLDLL